LASGEVYFSIVEILAFLRSREMVEKFSSLRSLSYKKILRILEGLGYDINSNNNNLNKVFENITKLDESELSKIESFLILEKEKLLEVIDWANSNLENEKVLKKFEELSTLRSDFIKKFHFKTSLQKIINNEI
jgi:hypothetical protein